MILDDITLNNFGLYAGSQTITLTPPSSDKPIILIGGLNGGGKTTFLDALQICLFGPHAKISNRGTLAYQEYLSRCIHRGTAASQAAIEMSFRHTVEGHEEHYRLHRSWRRNGTGCKEHFEVLKNGIPEPTLADNWASQVEEFFPANIAHLFLFDGEKVEAYASQRDSSALIGSAIQNLLGLDMVDQLEKDLQVYERRKRAEGKSDPLQVDIVASQDELRSLRQRIDSLKQERAALRTHRIDRHERRLREVQESYIKLGGSLYDQREAIEHRWAETKRAVKVGEAEMREFASGPAPLLMIRVLLESIEARDRHEEECRRARDLFEALRSRDRAALRHLRSQSVDSTVVEVLRKFFDADRAERQALGKKETVLDIPPDVRSDLHAFLQGDLDALASDAALLLKHQSERVAQLAEALIEYENIPSADAIAEVAQERQLLKNELAEQRALDAAMGQDIERQMRELERKEQALARLLEADAKQKGQRDDRTRILLHAAKVRSTLGAFRRVVIERHVRRIEQLVFESYQQLLRKSALVTRLSIDPGDFSLTLIGRDNDVLSAERLSAGERQLLAIALLWGLAKASGRPLPTAIDTPLGRLDSGHRMHVVERYLPFASHQVLLLSTDEEIAGACLEQLEPWIGRAYRLSYDDETGVTRIASGYLDAKEAA